MDRKEEGHTVLSESCNVPGELPQVKDAGDTWIVSEKGISLFVNCNILLRVLSIKLSLKDPILYPHIPIHKGP
jgi:hypothetical protein